MAAVTGTVKVDGRNNSPQYQYAVLATLSGTAATANLAICLDSLIGYDMMECHIYTDATSGNMTGKPAIEVYGTSVVDANNNGTAYALLATADGSFSNNIIRALPYTKTVRSLRYAMSSGTISTHICIYTACGQR